MCLISLKIKLQEDHVGNCVLFRHKNFLIRVRPDRKSLLKGKFYKCDGFEHSFSQNLRCRLNKYQHEPVHD